MNSAAGKHRQRVGLLGLGLLGALLLSGCSSVSVPPGLQPVAGFEPDRYLGRWYEIARLDHSFERGLTDVTADYSERKGGGLNVVNRGHDPAADRWKEARGVAQFLGERSVGSLKVSFFRPFYGGYHVIALDSTNYQHALVCGPSRDYLWILAREPQLPESVVSNLLAQADGWGFATNRLIWVTHEAPSH